MELAGGVARGANVDRKSLVVAERQEIKVEDIKKECCGDSIGGKPEPESRRSDSRLQPSRKGCVFCFAPGHGTKDTFFEILHTDDFTTTFRTRQLKPIDPDLRVCVCFFIEYLRKVLDDVRENIWCYATT